MTGVRGQTSGDPVPAHSPLRQLARRCLLLPFVTMLMGPPIAAGGQSTSGAPLPGQPGAPLPGQPTTPTPPDPPVTFSVTVIGDDAAAGRRAARRSRCPARCRPRPTATSTRAARSTSPTS